MKKPIHALICILFSVTVWGQGYEKATEYTPLTPQSAEIQRHGLTPINQYTGIPQIGVPFHSIDFDGKQIPVGLQYHAGGIRTNQEASWVGLGWSLSNQAVITRKINQYSDIGIGKFTQRGGGYCYGDIIPQPLTNEYLDSLEDSPLWNTPIAPDTQPDIFTASLFGEVVKFQLTQKGGAQGTIGTILLNDSKAKVHFNENDKDFRIIDAQGFTYEFKAKEYVTNFHATGTQRKIDDYFRMDVNDSEVNWSDGRDRYILTSWFVTKVTSPNGKVLGFSYHGDESFTDADSNNDVYYLSFSPTTVHEARTLIGCDGTAGGNLSTSNHPDYSYMRSIQENKYLKEIINFNTGERIVFKIGDRVDMEGYQHVKHNSSAGFLYGTRSYPGPQKLERIEVYSPSGKRIKQAVLNHGYFNSHKMNDAHRDNHLRLKLDDLAIDNKVHSFFYDQPNALPSKTTTGNDFWGFYNGNESNDTNAPVYRYPTQELSTHYMYGLCSTSSINPTNYYQPGGNLGSNFNYGKIGTLTKMTYPTGGYTEFKYESNSVKVNTDPSLVNIEGQTAMNLNRNILDTNANPVASTSSNYIKTFKVGGLRINSVENRNRNNQLLLKKSYRYHGFDGSSIPMSSGKLMSGLVYFYPVESFGVNGNNFLTAL
ncbi:MAG: hypothetical protein AB3N16_09735, partial [Flavobacteriaceae bacterium]